MYSIIKCCNVFSLGLHSQTPWWTLKIFPIFRMFLEERNVFNGYDYTSESDLDKTTGKYFVSMMHQTSIF